MFRLGRTPVLLIGIGTIASSNILISFLESYSLPFAIAFSFLSRILSGCGCAIITIACNAIIISDYPTEIPKLIALAEVFGGAGLIIGPSFGSLIFAFGGFSTSCMIIGIFTLIWIPILFMLMGPSRPYRINAKEKVSLGEITLKPVMYT